MAEYPKVEARDGQIGVAFADGFAERGSLEWHLHLGGDFLKALCRTVQLADEENLARLRRAFPQVVAAWEQHSWFKAPPGFDPVYNAPAEAET
jgi:hypothetical protein